MKPSFNLTPVTILAVTAALLLLVLSPQSRAAGLVVRQGVSFKAGSITADSFNSTNEAYSSAGLYDTNKALDHGDITSLSETTNFVDLGSSKIKGTLHTGPNGRWRLGPQGSVGDMDFVNSGATGLQVGHWKPDAQYNFLDASLPSTAGKPWLTPVPGNYIVNGTTYKYQLNAINPWYLDDLDGSVWVNGSGVRLYVRSAVTFPTNGAITIPPGKSLAMYVGAPNAVICGITNGTGVANNFKYYGLSGNTNVQLSTTGALAGVIYAPQADLTLIGDTNAAFDVAGSIVAKSLMTTGHFDFHIDEAIYWLDPPVITSQPSDHTALSGDTVRFAVSATNSMPLRYQWQFAETNLPAATNSTLSLTNVTSAAGGNYRVQVDNGAISVTSTSAVLLVYESAAALLGVPSYSLDGGLQFNVDGVPGFAYTIEISTNLIDWMPLTTNTAPFLFTDSEAATAGQRFYRSVYLH